jgi:hypothetical protein
VDTCKWNLRITGFPRYSTKCHYMTLRVVCGVLLVQITLSGSFFLSEILHSHQYVNTFLYHFLSTCPITTECSPFRAKECNSSHPHPPKKIPHILERTRYFPRAKLLIWLQINTIIINLLFHSNKYKAYHRSFLSLHFWCHNYYYTRYPLTWPTIKNCTKIIGPISFLKP